MADTELDVRQLRKPDKHPTCKWRKVLLPPPQDAVGCLLASPQARHPAIQPCTDAAI
jgi:hypothetical protein